MRYYFTKLLLVIPVAALMFSSCNVTSHTEKAT